MSFFSGYSAFKYLSIYFTRLYFCIQVYIIYTDFTVNALFSKFRSTRCVESINSLFSKFRSTRCVESIFISPSILFSLNSGLHSVWNLYRFCRQFSFLQIQVYTVCGIYIAFAVVAFLLICFFLDPIVLDKEEDAEKRKFSFRLTLETLKHLAKSHYQKLLVILTMYSGIEQAFMTGDYTKVKWPLCLLSPPRDQNYLCYAMFTKWHFIYWRF